MKIKRSLILLHSATLKISGSLMHRGQALGDWAAFIAANEAFAARRSLLRLGISACDRNLSLSDPSWTSDPILTSDGLAVNLGLGIWWRIANPGTYVSAIASDYHEGNEHRNENLSEAAEFWIKKLAAGTLREEVNQLPAEKLISPYVQAYLQVRRGPEGELLPEGQPLPKFSEQLEKAQQKLNEKTLRYGIEIERLEVQELVLPRIYQDKLEAVRVAFLEPSHTRALTDAQVYALKGLASVIGEDKVGLIEILKHVDLSHVSMNPFTGVIPVVQPVLDTLQKQTEKAFPAKASQGPALPPASGNDKPR